MKNLLRALLPATLLVTGCAVSAESELMTDAEAERQVCNNEYNRDAGRPDCWVEFYQEEDYSGHCVRVYGPIALADLEDEAFGPLDGEIGSVRVGPAARLHLFDDENFQDERQVFEPRMKVRQLEHAYVDDDAESFRILYVED